MLSNRTAPKNQTAKVLLASINALMKVEKFFMDARTVKVARALRFVSVFLVVAKLFGANPLSWFLTTLFLWLPLAASISNVVILEALRKKFVRVNA